MSDKVPYHAYEKRGKMIEERDKRIAELEAKKGRLLTVLYAADAFMGCPTENYLELSKLAETLQEAIDIASDKHDPFDDLLESGGLPEAQALKGADE